MRTEAQMMALILDFGRSQERVRAMVLNGSRANPNAPKDPFRDYDVACVVPDLAPFRGRADLPGLFGELMILQTPEDMGEPPEPSEDFYSYLMQFMDGNRIDLSFHPLHRAQALVEDSLSVVLLDKDGIFGSQPAPSDRSYLPLPPTPKGFADCCNEFWWLNTYVAKGLWRAELTYARYLLDYLMRGELLKMLTWYFGLQTGYQKSPGKQGKYIRGQIPPQLWAQLERTYAAGTIENSWEALFEMDDLFLQLARPLAQVYGFSLPGQEISRVSAYIRVVHGMPADAQTIPLP